MTIKQVTLSAISGNLGFALDHVQLANKMLFGTACSSGDMVRVYDHLERAAVLVCDARGYLRYELQDGIRMIEGYEGGREAEAERLIRWIEETLTDMATTIGELAATLSTAHCVDV